MQILELLNKSVNKSFSKSDILNQDELREKAKENLPSLNSQYYIENIGGIKNTTPYIQPLDIHQNNNYNIDFYLNRINLLTDLSSNVSIPFLTKDNAVFAIGSKENAKLTYSKVLKPHRIYSYCELPLSYAKRTNENLTGQFTEEINRAVFSKVIDQMFSSNKETEEAPKGLLFNTTSEKVTDNETLLSAIEKGNQLNDDMVYLLSPCAYTKLMLITPQSFQDNKLFGKEYLIDNRVETNKMLIISLSNIYLALWKYVGCTIDNITNISNGMINLTIENFVDYDIKPNSMLVVEF